MNLRVLPALSVLLWATTATPMRAGDEPPVRLGPDWKAVPAAVGARIATDREYHITLLPKALAGGTLCARSALQFAKDPAGTIELTSPAVVFVAVVYHQNNLKPYSDEKFEARAAEGWEFVEEEFKTTTYQSDYVLWQVLRKEHPAGPLHFPTHGATCLFFLGGPTVPAPSSP